MTSLVKNLLNISKIEMGHPGLSEANGSHWRGSGKSTHGDAPPSRVLRYGGGSGAQEYCLFDRAHCFDVIGRGGGRYRCLSDLAVVQASACGALTRMFYEFPLRGRGEGCATGQSRGTAGLDPRRTFTVRCRAQGPRTPGRTVLLFALATLRSVPQAGSQFRGRSRRFVKHSG